MFVISENLKYEETVAGDWAASGIKNGVQNCCRGCFEMPRIAKTVFFWEVMCVVDF